MVLNDSVDSKQLKEKKSKKNSESTDKYLKSLPRLQRRTISTKSGREIEADLVFNCTGTRLNNRLLKQNFSQCLDENGRLIVNSNMQVEGYSNVFAVGDITNVEEVKMAYNAGRHAPVVANNIKVLAGKSKKMKDYIPTKPLMVLSTGRNGGRFLSPFGVLGNTATRLLKSKEVFTTRIWTALHLPPPK